MSDHRSCPDCGGRGYSYSDPDGKQLKCGMCDGFGEVEEEISEPHGCPVCHGQGTVSKPPYIAGDQPTWTASNSTPYPCPACNGTGVIWEKE